MEGSLSVNVRNPVERAFHLAVGACDVKGELICAV
jgi:hypothetical protein